jgi:hypothetical protein
MLDFDRRGYAMCSRMEEFQQTGRHQAAYKHLGHVQMYNTKTVKDLLRVKLQFRKQRYKRLKK